MRITARETQNQTLARLIRAWDHRQPVTVTYTKADGTETVRTIEIYDVTTSKAGDILIKAMDRESGESRTWRLDRIAAYTVHRSSTYVVTRESSETPAGHGLRAAVVELAAVTPATEQQAVTVLADYLTAA